MPRLSWVVTMPYCYLCGTENPYYYKTCSKCEIPYGRGRYHDLPKGYASCRIVEEFIEYVDDNHERARLLAEVRTNKELTYPLHSVEFVHEKYNEDRTWYERTENDNLIHREFENLIRQTGWIDVIGGNGKPTNNEFWRRTE